MLTMIPTPKMVAANTFLSLYMLTVSAVKAMIPAGDTRAAITKNPQEKSLGAIMQQYCLDHIVYIRARDGILALSNCVSFKPHWVLLRLRCHPHGLRKPQNC